MRKSGALGQSPQAACLVRASEQGHGFVVVRGLERARDPTREIKHYGSFATAADAIGSGAGPHAFYELIREGKRKKMKLPLQAA